MAERYVWNPRVIDTLESIRPVAKISAAVLAGVTAVGGTVVLANQLLPKSYPNEINVAKLPTEPEKVQKGDTIQRLIHKVDGNNLSNKMLYAIQADMVNNNGGTDVIYPQETVNVPVVPWKHNELSATSTSGEGVPLGSSSGQ